MEELLKRLLEQTQSEPEVQPEPTSVYESVQRILSNPEPDRIKNERAIYENTIPGTPIPFAKYDVSKGVQNRMTPDYVAKLLRAKGN